MYHINQILPLEFHKEIEYAKATCIKVIKKQTSVMLKIIKSEALINYSKVFIKNDGKYREHNIDFIKGVKSLDNNYNLVIAYVNDDVEYKCSISETEFDLKLKEISSLIKENLVKQKIEEYDIIEYDIPITYPYSNKQIESIKDKWPVYFNLNKLSLSVADHSTKDILLVNELIKEHFSGNIDNKAFIYNPITKVSITLNKDWICGRKNNKNPLNHATMEIIDYFSELITSKIGNIKPNIKEEEVDNNNFLKLKEGNDITDKSSEVETVNLSDQYYLKNWYIFLIKEPCVMCTFALIHSRIDRIYFIEENLMHGGLLNKVKMIDYHDKINHSYKAFKLIKNSNYV